MATQRTYLDKEVKKSTTFNLRVFLQDTGTSNPNTGVTITDISVILVKASGAPVTKSLVSGDLTELSSSNAPGWYDLKLSTTDTNTLGMLLVRILDNGGGIDAVEVTVEVTEVTTNDLLRLIGLSHEYWKENNISYDVSNPKRKTGSTITLYRNGTDLDAGTNSIATYTYAATFGNDGLPSSFSFKRTA